jgi:hypothetical protein
MVDKTRRQGQKKPNGKTAIPKPICPKCGEYMRRMYSHEAINEKRRYVGAAWMCPASTCDYIVKDFVELEDIEGED